MHFFTKWVGEVGIEHITEHFSKITNCVEISGGGGGGGGGGVQETERMTEHFLFHHKACDTTDNTSIIKVINQFVYFLYLRQSIIPKHKFPSSQIRFRRIEITALATHFFQS